MGRAVTGYPSISAGVDDPVEEHAAPLPADGGDQEAQERRVGHVPTAASRRMTAARRRPTNRVRHVGS